MIVITNEKVAGFEPRWATFRGFSLLFDNPGDSLTPEGNLLKTNCRVREDPELSLYRALADSLEATGRDLLANAYLFCPLPSASYHVTVWDGLNDGNVRRASPDLQEELAQFLSRLPDALLESHPVMEPIRASSLAAGSDWTITFRFKDLVKWGNRVLVARLEPADPDAEAAFERIVEARQALSADFERRFGIPGPGGYAPHVSLGYFANREGAEQASFRIAEWNDRLKRSDLPSVTYRTIRLYGFMNMGAFFVSG